MRFFVFVVNGLGIGPLPSINSAVFSGNCFLDINKRINLNLPNLKKLGIYNIDNSEVSTTENVDGSFGKLAISTKSKGLLFDYLEIFGYEQKNIKRNLLGGFSDKIIKKLEQKVGLGFICNQKYEGYKAIDDFGAEHLKTGKPILYFSEDNTVQVASNLSITTKERLYEICEIISKNLTLTDGVSKVVARPFYGAVGNFCRTLDRKDFYFNPKLKLKIEKLAKHKKIIFLNDFAKIFKNVRNTHVVETDGDEYTKSQFLQIFNLNFEGIVFANISNLLHLGKKQDYLSYGIELEKLDQYVELLLKSMKADDNVIIMGNHSSNPLNSSFECGLEYVPILAVGKNCKENYNCGIIKYSELINKIFKIINNKIDILE